MINRQKRIWFTVFSGIVLLLVGSVSISYAQSPVDFRGTWNTVTGKGKKIVITMETVRRTSVTGTYGRNGLTASYEPVDDRSVNSFVRVSFTTAGLVLQTANSIRGTVTDNVLRFKWFEDGGHGAGRFTMSSDGQSFEGTFSLTEDPDDTSGGTWNGTRAPNFHGVWQTSVGGKLQFPDLLLQQSGNQVVGQLSANGPQLGIIRDGVIDGNTLRFTIWRSRTNIPGSFPDLYVGNGELVMDKGSKAFKGTIIGTSVSGTRLGR